MEGNHTTGQGMPEASRCVAAGDRARHTGCCCPRSQRPLWGTRSGLQPQAEAGGSVLTRRAGFSPFPEDPEGERSSFRNAESSRKSITLSMPEQGPRKVGRRAEDRHRGDMWTIVAIPSLREVSFVGVTLSLGGGNDC